MWVAQSTMDVAELVTIGQATGCSPVYLDDHSILLSHSRGLVACDTQSGLQVGARISGSLRTARRMEPLDAPKPAAASALRRSFA